MTEILLPYGMRRGSLVHISSEDILSGLTDCTCPECGEHLVARKGDHNRHHFAHKGDAGRPINGRCRGGFETAAHLRAKEIIEEAGKIRFPDNMVWKLDRVWLEKKIQPSALRPDIIVSADQRTAVIEIFVTNRCSPAKISLLKQQRIPSMEIRLANWRYAVKDDNAYRQAVLHGAPRLWLYDPSEEANKAARAIIEDARREQLARAEFLSGLPSAHAERNRDHGGSVAPARASIWDEFAPAKPSPDVYVELSDLKAMSADGREAWINAVMDPVRREYVRTVQPRVRAAAEAVRLAKGVDKP